MKKLKIMIMLVCVTALVAVCMQKMQENKCDEITIMSPAVCVDIGAVIQAGCYR